MTDITQEIIDACDNKEDFVAVNYSGLNIALLSKNFKNVVICEYDPAIFNSIMNHTFDNVDVRQNVVYNESKDFVFVYKDVDKTSFYTSSSLTIDSLNYKFSCIVINNDFFQKNIVLGSVDNIRYNLPLIVMKKNDLENSDTKNILDTIFQYKKFKETNDYYFLKHWSKI